MEVARSVKQSYAEAVLNRRPYDRVMTNSNFTETRKFENEMAFMVGQSRGVDVFMETIFALIKEAELAEEKEMGLEKGGSND
jgi:hypothetical protein